MTGRLDGTELEGIYVERAGEYVVIRLELHSDAEARLLYEQIRDEFDRGEPITIFGERPGKHS